MQSEEEIRWLNRLIEDFEGSVRRGAWQLEQFEGSRAELRGVWDDSCSRELAMRFFGPHAEEASRQIANLRYGETQLREVSRSIRNGNDQLTIATDRHSDFQSHISESATIFHTIDSLMSEALERTGESGALMNQSRSLIEQAEAAGNSAPAG